MSFDSSKLVTDPVMRVRLLVGDIQPDYPILDDQTYEYIIFETTTEIEAAIEALENILNFFSLTPDAEGLGGVNGSGISLKQLERQLSKLKNKISADKTGTGRVPVIIKTDRKSWDDFNSLFGEE